MYQDVQLPADEAWDNMAADLRTAKGERNALTKENK